MASFKNEELARLGVYLFNLLATALAREFAEALSKIFQMRPELCIVITESNGSLLDRVDCTMMNLERGELTVELHR